MEEQLKQQIAFANNKYEGRITEINQRIEDKKQAIINQEQANTKLQSDIISNADRNKSRYMAVKLQREKDLGVYQEEKQQQLDIINAQVVEIEDKVFMLRNDQRNIQAEINRLINQNQVYRMAMYAYGTESQADVDRHMVATVALIWFGSLALIASVTGVMLSLAGFYLKRQLISSSQEDAQESMIELAQGRSCRVPR